MSETAVVLTMEDLAAGDEYLTAEEAGELIRLSAWSIRWLVREGKLAGYSAPDMRRALRVKKSDVLGLMGPRRTAAADA